MFIGHIIRVKGVKVWVSVRVGLGFVRIRRIRGLGYG